jgi:hypothetical protein
VNTLFSTDFYFADFNRLIAIIEYFTVFVAEPMPVKVVSKSNVSVEKRNLKLESVLTISSLKHPVNDQAPNNNAINKGKLRENVVI